MFSETAKRFVEKHIDLIDTNQFRELFLAAYYEELLTPYVIDIHNMLKDSGIFDSTNLRNDLLFETIESALTNIKLKHISGENTVKETFVVQFLRHYLLNTFGFLESEAVQFMYENQNLLGIKLIPTGNLQRTPQGKYDNYEIFFVK